MSEAQGENAISYCPMRPSQMFSIDLCCFNQANLSLVPNLLLVIEQSQQVVGLTKFKTVLSMDCLHHCYIDGVAFFAIYSSSKTHIKNFVFTQLRATIHRLCLSSRGVYTALKLLSSSSHLSQSFD